MIEIVGTVEEVGDDFLVIKIAYKIPFMEEELKKWAKRLRIGSRVGVLLMEDGSIRIRLI